MAVVQLSRGLVAYVDDADLSLLAGRSWQATPSYSTTGEQIGWYAQSSRRVNGRRLTDYMHRVIVGAKRGQKVDHRDGDGLNNRRVNIRACTTSQNNSNRPAKPARSGFRGVHGGPSRWLCQCEKGGKIHRRFGFTSAEAAARSYDALATDLFGEFAVLNFPASGRH